MNGPSILKLAGLALGLLLGALPTASAAAVGDFPTLDEALKLCFGEEIEIEKQTVYLTDDQKARVRELCGEKLPRGIVRPYTVSNEEGEVLGVGFVDTHKVRSKKESVLFCIAPNATIRRVEVLAFGEPPDYIPSGRWYAEFNGQALTDRLRLDRDITAVTGATLTTVATVSAARRSLALHQLLFPQPEPEPEPEEGEDEEEEGEDPEPKPEPVPPKPEPGPKPKPVPPKPEGSLRTRAAAQPEQTSISQ
ncbi:MAG: FMN-binding protein [Planctomycetota bacterium]|jgi:hypothetical protein